MYEQEINPMSYNTKSTDFKPRPLDYLYLYLLCFRSGAFSHTNRFFRHARDKCRKTLFGTLTRLGLFWYEFAAKFYIVVFPIFLIFTVYYLIRSLFFGEFWRSFWWFVIAAFFTFILVDWPNIENVKNYFRSVWWQNTRTRPHEVWKDSGTYGEWKATCYLEHEFEKAGLKAKIHNRLLIPKTQHKETAFTEADIVAVTELGIFAFEVKHYDCSISGVYDSEYWSAIYDEDTAFPMYNPFMQNQGHINYMAEYLYRTTRECFAPGFLISEHFTNIVLFADTMETKIKLGGNLFKRSAWFSTNRIYEETALSSRLASLEAVRLSDEQISEISRALLPMTDYTQEVYDAIIQEKIEAEERDRRDKELNPNSSRYAAAEYCAIRIEGRRPLLLRKNGDNHLAVAESEEDLFRAIPELYDLTVEKQSDWKYGLNGLREADKARFGL